MPKIKPIGGGGLFFPLIVRVLFFVVSHWFYFWRYFDLSIFANSGDTRKTATFGGDTKTGDTLSFENLKVIPIFVILDFEIEKRSNYAIFVQGSRNVQKF